MDLNLVRLQLSLSPAAACLLQPLVTGHGGIFEAALLRTGCTAPVCDCAGCLQHAGCLASSLLSRSLSPDPELLRRYQKPSVPFMFSQPQAGEPIVHLTLAGPACDALALFADTLEAVADEQVRTRLEAFDYQEQLIPLQFQADGQCSNLPLLSLAELFEQYHRLFVGCRSVEVVFQTPLRLRHNGRELQQLQPAVLIRGLLRRLSSLAAYYGTAGDTDRLATLAARADEVMLVTCEPAVACRRGVCGRYQLNGPFEEFGPYMALGSLVHLGKGAAYGQGRFTVTRLD